MTGYTKLFQTIITSTIWNESNDCKALWITILALKGKDHICRATVPSLAKLNNLSIEDTEKHLKKFQEPDPYSRSTEFDGRRIQRVDGGWLVLNGNKYSQLMRSAERTEYVKEKVREHRARHAVNNVNNVNQSNHRKPISDTDTDTDTDSEKNKELLSKESNGSVRAVIYSWISLYESYYDKEYVVVRGKDHKRAKDLLRQFTVDELEDLFAVFLKSDIPNRLGASLSVFASMINQVVQLRGKNDNRRTQ